MTAIAADVAHALAQLQAAHAAFERHAYAKTSRADRCFIGRNMRETLMVAEDGGAFDFGAAEAFHAYMTVRTRQAHRTVWADFVEPVEPPPAAPGRPAVIRFETERCGDVMRAFHGDRCLATAIHRRRYTTGPRWTITRSDGREVATHDGPFVTMTLRREARAYLAEIEAVAAAPVGVDRFADMPGDVLAGEFHPLDVGGGPGVVQAAVLHRMVRSGIEPAPMRAQPVQQAQARHVDPRPDEAIREDEARTGGWRDAALANLVPVFVVAVYLTCRVVGGREGGGWSYTAGERMTNLGIPDREFRSADDATAFCERLQRNLDQQENAGRVEGSARYQARVYEGAAPERFPTRPPRF